MLAMVPFSVLRHGRCQASQGGMDGSMDDEDGRQCVLWSGVVWCGVVWCGVVGWGGVGWGGVWCGQN